MSFILISITLPLYVHISCKFNAYLVFGRKYHAPITMRQLPCAYNDRCKVVLNRNDTILYLKKTMFCKKHVYNKLWI